MPKSDTMVKQYALRYLLLIGFLWTGRVLAQKPGGDSTRIPAFLIALENGVHFSNTDLKPDKPLLLVYFSPTC